MAKKSKLQYKEFGGTIFKPRGTDTVPAMLTPGEYVLNAEAVESIGVDNLEYMNETGSLPVSDARMRRKKLI
tara:strand:- start:463 stop:678 length:216 start_codon:yes stop_codon:yes gene_type:complete